MICQNRWRDKWTKAPRSCDKVAIGVYVVMRDTQHPPLPLDAPNSTRWARENFAEIPLCKSCAAFIGVYRVKEQTV